MDPTVLDVNMGHHPFGALILPGDDRPRALVQRVGDGVHLIDPDGMTTWTNWLFTAGNPVLPPTAHWHQLRPRDPEGSAALREIDHETAGALLKAAMAGDEDLASTVRTLIPRISDDTLAAGVAGVARFAAERRAALDGMAERLGERLADAAGIYLMVLAMPDPTDKNVARWTGWKPARLKAARAELAATDLVVEARRARAGRSLFLPGGWEALKSPHLPVESWKIPLFGLFRRFKDLTSPLGVIVPAESAVNLYQRVWQRVLDGDAPRFSGSG